MVYEVKNHWLIKNGKKIELTNKEHELLMILSNNEFNNLSDISLKIYRNN
jgi:DNA-binding response OmpR family regulator